MNTTYGRHPFEAQTGSLVCAACGMTRGSVRHSVLGSTRHMAPKTCRKIEPVLIRDMAGHLVVQACARCDRDLEATPTGWRHIK